MKKLLLLLFLVSSGLFAQTKVTPDCVIPFSFTAAGSTSNSTCGAPNGAPNGNGIASWIVVYYNTGFSGLSVTVQSAADSSGAPGTWGTFAGTVLTSTQYPGSSGINPNTATTSAFTGLAGYYPWMRVTISGLTGSGKVTGALYGFYNSTLAKAGSGGGGGGITVEGTANQIVFTPSDPCSSGTCQAALTTNVVIPGTFTTGSGSGVTGAHDFIGKTSGATSTVTVDDSNTATVVKLPNDATSGLYAATSPTATPATGCAAFNGTGTQLTSTGAECGSGGGGSGAGPLGYSGTAVILPSAGTTYLAPVGGAAASTTEATVSGKAPSASSISNLFVSMSAAPGTGNTIAFTYRDAGSSTALTCTISGASATSCSDITHSFTPTLGDALSVQVVTTGTVVITPTINIMAVYGIMGGGGGGGITLGTFAALPSPTASGTEYKQTDGPYEWISDGSAWHAFWNGFQVTTPPTTGWTSEGIASESGSTAGTVHYTNGFGYLIGNNLNTESLGAQYRTQPSTPYGIIGRMTTDTSGVIGQAVYNPNNGFTNGPSVLTGTFLGFRSSTGQYLGIGNIPYTGTNVFITIAFFNSDSSYNGNAASQQNVATFQGTVANRDIAYKIHNDGTTLIFYMSFDGGQVFVPVWQEAITTHLADATYVAWGAHKDSGSAGVALWDWTITN
jgi:hypothetical protein